MFLTELHFNDKYQWARLEVGKAVTIKSPDPSFFKSAVNAAYAYGKRNGKKFTSKRFKSVCPQSGDDIYHCVVWRTA
jgi:NADPH-dependent 7-cyano-7-deazaguanine reductase QueF